MIVTTDKSTIISGLKHGSTNSALIASEYINELFPSWNLSRGEAHTSSIRIDFFTRVLSRHFVQGMSYKQFSDINLDSSFKFDTLSVKFFYDEFLKNLFDINSKPIFIFIKEPTSSFMSAFVEDFSQILFKRRKIISKIYPSYYQFYFSKDYHKKNLIEFLNSVDEKDINLVVTQSLKLFSNEFSKGNHISTLHLSRVVVLLSYLKEYFPNAFSRTFIVNLDKYDKKLIPYLAEMKVFYPNESGKIKSVNSNKILVELLSPFFPENPKTLPLGKIRLDIENTMFSHIEKVYRDKFLTEFNIK